MIFGIIKGVDSWSRVLRSIAIELSKGALRNTTSILVNPKHASLRSRPYSPRPAGFLLLGFTPPPPEFLCKDMFEAHIVTCKP